MKKFLLLLLFIPFLFCSCIWVPSQSMDTIKQKKSMKDFSKVENPLVVTFGVPLEFNWAFSKNAETSIVDFGNIYAVYDLDSGKCFDWLCDAAADFNEVTILPEFKTSDGKSKFMGSYSRSPFVVCLDTNGNEAYTRYFQMDKKMSLIGITGSNTYSSNILMCTAHDPNDMDENNRTLCRLYFYKVDDMSCLASTEFRTTAIKFNSLPDADGNFWLCYTGYDRKTDKELTSIAMVDTKNYKLSEPIITLSEDNVDYKLTYVDSEYLVVNASNSEDYKKNKLYFINRSTLETITFVTDNINYSFGEVVKVKDKYYTTLCGTTNVDGILRFCEIDMTSKTVVSEIAKCEFSKSVPAYFVRGDKIFFTVSKEKRDGFFINWYDPATATFGKTQEISVDTLLGK